MRILLIEDDVSLCGYTAKAFVEAGHVLESANDGKAGLQRASTEDFDLLIVDRMLPCMDGLTVIRTLRDAGNTTPALILSALGEVDDRVKGLRSGGDDYLVKPYAFDELLARAEILGRRAANDPGQPETILRAADLEVDLLTRKVKRGDKILTLQTREFHLLEFLLRHKDQVVTRAMLLQAVWEYHFDPQTNVIDVHVSRLRRKIDKDFPNPIIKTVRGAGYIIEESR